MENNRWEVYSPDDIKKVKHGFNVCELLNSESLCNLAEICGKRNWDFKALSKEMSKRIRSLSLERKRKVA